MRGQGRLSSYSKSKLISVKSVVQQGLICLVLLFLVVLGEAVAVFGYGWSLLIQKKILYNIYLFMFQEQSDELCLKCLKLALWCLGSSRSLL